MNWICVSFFVKAPPPQLVNVRSLALSPTSIQLTWSLPSTTELAAIERIIFGFGVNEESPNAVQQQDLQTTFLEKGATSHIVRGLEPGTRFNAMFRTENKYGRSEPFMVTVETLPLPGMLLCSRSRILQHSTSLLVALIKHALYAYYRLPTWRVGLYIASKSFDDFFLKKQIRNSSIMKNKTYDFVCTEMINKFGLWVPKDL